VCLVEPAELRRNYARVASLPQCHKPDGIAERARLSLNPVPPVEVKDPELVAAAPREDRLDLAVVLPHRTEGFEREQTRVLDLVLEERGAHQPAQRQASHVTIHVDAEVCSNGVCSV
jgi:hypothetical protein